MSFHDDDRAITSGVTDGKSEVYVDSQSQAIRGGTMVAENAGELVQELILAMEAKLSINHVFNKIYPYPVATRVNQQLILKHKQNVITSGLKKLLHIAFKIFS